MPPASRCRCGSLFTRTDRSPSSPASGRRRVRKLKQGEVEADLFGFLTTEPNAEVGAVHPKATRLLTFRKLARCRHDEAPRFGAQEISGSSALLFGSVASLPHFLFQNHIGLVQARRPAASATAIRTKPPRRRRSSCKTARVARGSRLWTASEPRPSAMMEFTGEVTTSTESSLKRTSSMSGPWLE